MSDANDGRRVLDLATSEKDFQAQIVELAQRTGWLVFHPYDMRRSREGYPDLTMVHEDRRLLIFAELKRQDPVRGRLSAKQEEWIGALMTVSLRINGEAYQDRVFVRIWRPSDWPEIEELLTGPQR